MTVYESFASRVLLGAGARHDVSAELDRLGVSQAFVVATGSAKAAADELVGRLGDRYAVRFDGPVVHTPVAVTDAAMQRIAERPVDVIVAIGGGSAVGLSKAISARTRLPQVVLPTTYAGSEVTPALGETANGVKTTRRDPELVPGTVVYDPELTVSMPAGLTLTSAINALAHAVEALWAPSATTVSNAMAVEAVDALLNNLPDVLDDPTDLRARSRLQEGAWLAGLCLSQTQMGLHHQLAHALGGTFDLPHAPLHALLLPHVMAFNLGAAPDAARRLARVVDGDPAAKVAALSGRYDGPTTLSAFGVPHDGLREIAARVSADPYPNPRPVVEADVLALLEAAW